MEYEKNQSGQYSRTRSYAKMVQSTPFSSENKFSEVIIDKGSYYLSLLKGAPEKIIDKCNLEKDKKEKILKKVVEFASLGNRILCFSHSEFKGDLNAEKIYEFDGFVVISDTIRKEVYSAIEKSKTAGIDVKMLTGDNIATATNIAYKTGILTKNKKVVTADYIDKLSFDELKKEIKDICVIARSTPIIKLKVVKALNAIGEVTCVTGDGVNDAPAIRQADVGISMGITGSEITKDASDIVLLDDSFNTVINAISFGRTVYKNLKRFIFFQLSVNISALLITVISLLCSFQSPFSAMQLLFVNIIMDGPPALTLGLEKPDGNTMKNPPVKRNAPLITKSEFFKVLLTGAFVATVTFLQYAFNFLNVKNSEITSSTFMLFLTFSLFNAFNARAIGTVSAFFNIKNNKVMAVTFLATFLLYLLLSTFCPKLIGVTALSIVSVIKVVLTASTIIFVFEAVKLIKRKLKK
jgi:Ca2+-transporting ATPase